MPMTETGTFMPEPFKRLYEIPPKKRSKKQREMIEAITEVIICWEEAEDRAARLQREVEPLRTFKQDVLNRSVAPANQGA